MEQIFLNNEPWIRLGAFSLVFLSMALAESWLPRRKRQFSKADRWSANLGLFFVDTLLVRLVFPTAAVGLALYAEQHQWGLLNTLSLPRGVEIIAAVVLLDGIIYLQHVMFHAVPAFWRLHRVHHADLDFDVTTGIRFHPIEILLSMLLKFAAVAALGAPAIGVLIFEILLNATSLFNHSNLQLPQWTDQFVRFFIVTPDMHRVHHSVIPQETNSNFGFNLSCWDKLFGTYRAQPALGHIRMTIGLRQFRQLREQSMLKLLIQPFISKLGEYSLVGRNKKK